MNFVSDNNFNKHFILSSPENLVSTICMRFFKKIINVLITSTKYIFCVTYIIRSGLHISRCFYTFNYYYISWRNIPYRITCFFCFLDIVLRQLRYSRSRDIIMRLLYSFINIEFYTQYIVLRYILYQFAF